MNYMTVDSPDAPWHDREYPPKEIEVCVSVSLSKTVKVYVGDYDIDEEGIPDFSESDIVNAVKRQITLPQKLFPDWNTDEFECVRE